ncbi:MAG: T9SS type A sorting domain-containing protein, partial [Chlorobi bacterium]|nr:T9SS type A sorting domain-containing protein [Chlorobiota bacterium]
MKKLTFLFLIILSTVSFSQNYKKIQIAISNKSDISLIAEKGIPIESAFVSKENTIDLFVNESEYNSILELGLPVTVLIDNWKNYYNALPKMSEAQKNDALRESKEKFGVTGFNYGTMGGYLTYQEALDELDEMRSDYPDLITVKTSIGQTLEGREMYVVKISQNADVNEGETEVFFNSLIHAREPEGMMTVVYYMWYLLENYGTDPEVTYLLNNREIYFLPVFNADGYEYNRSTDPNGGGMWRKNRRDNDDGSEGVDLNRNWGYKWGYDNDGSSGYGGSETYRGTAAFSEPATENVRQFVGLHNFKTVLNYHTYSNLLINPWGYVTAKTPDSLIYQEYSSEMTQYNGYTWGGSEIIYNVNGAADDWMYGEQTVKNKIISMTPEVGSSSDGFWPPQSRIIPLAEENIFPNLYITWAAGEFVKVNGVTFGQDYFAPGDHVEMTINLKNKGLSDAQNVSATISSTDLNIIVDNNSAAYGLIPSRGSNGNLVPFTFDISASAPIGSRQTININIYNNGDLMLTDHVTITIGVPTSIFEDPMDNPTTNWTVSASPSTPKWDVTTATSYTLPSCYTDSKNGNYVDNSTNIMTLTDPIDLTGITGPYLEFWSKWDIEGNWDYGTAQISTDDGVSWAYLEGNYTNPGSGSFQPNGSPIYDGTQLSWVKEEINLDAYTGQQIKIRFKLVTDGGVTRDGWYLDDIKVYYYAAVPVELTSFSAGATDENVNLNWTTATETNNKGFFVERKSSFAQGDNAWNQIGFVEGNGTTSETQNYSFTDKNLSKGKYFYRLKQIDFDGTFDYSSIVEVSVEPVYQYSLEQNYPNPFNPSTKIVYSIKETGNVKLILYNSLGEKIYMLINEEQSAGAHVFDLNTDALPVKLTSGIYYYALESGNFRATKKLVL